MNYIFLYLINYFLWSHVFSFHFSNIHEIYASLKVLTYFDPLLLRTIFCICPFHELPSLFLLVPMNISTKFMVHLIETDRKPLLKEKVHVYLILFYTVVIIFSWFKSHLFSEVPWGEPDYAMFVFSVSIVLALICWCNVDTSLSLYSRLKT